MVQYIHEGCSYTTFELNSHVQLECDCDKYGFSSGVLSFGPSTRTTNSKYLRLKHWLIEKQVLGIRLMCFRAMRTKTYKTLHLGSMENFATIFILKYSLLIY